MGGRKGFLVWCFTVCLPVCAAAQSVTGTGALQGMVVDRTGAALVGVEATATQQGSGALRTTQTDATGQFQLPGLAVGIYTLRLKKEGFTPAVIDYLQVSVGQTLACRIEMQLTEVLETVEVREQPEALQAAATTLGVALGGERIEESPAPNRNSLNFVLLTPAVTPSSGSNSQRSLAGLRSATADSGFSSGGLRGRNNSLSIDGVDNRDETTGGMRVAIGLEMVQEFRVSGMAVGAELGGAAGGLVNVVTRSGTNIWHGDATFFAQNELFNARNPEVESGVKPRFRRYQPGTSVSGPIRKDRTFFSTAFEQEWESGQEWSDTPSAALEAVNGALSRADFSSAPVHSALRGLFDSKASETEYSLKVDHRVGTKHSLSGRYAYSRGRITGDVQGVDDFSERSARGSSLTQDHSFVLGWVSVPSAHTVNDLRLQWARRHVDLTPNALGPMLEIPGLLTLGQSYNLDASRTEDHYEIVESVHLMAGKHQWSFGGSLQTVRLEARLANRFAGIFLFPTLEDFWLGRPDVFIQAFGDPKTHLTTVPVGLWLQERWQARPGLTLEAGLRYDRQRMPAGFTASTRNLAPRLGLAWRPGGTAPFVLRAGFGLFYDRYPLAFLNDALQKNGRQGFEQYVTGEAAAAAFALSRGGALAAPLSGVPPSVYRPDANFRATYSQKVTAGVERSLGKDTTLSMEYASVRGFHLPRVRNLSGGLPALYQLEQTARSSYQGASLSLNRRMSRELTFLLAYQVGRTHDDASDFDEHPLDPHNLRQEWARSRQHQAQRVAASALFELPADEWRSGPAWLRGSMGHVVVAPIFHVGSGRPVNALDSTDALRTGAYPISARPFGLGRNPYFSPSTVSLDLRILKGFPLKHDRAILQVGVEAFNLGNHSNPLRVSPYYAAQGRRLASYGSPIEMLNPRQIQLVVQVEY